MSETDKSNLISSLTSSTLPTLWSALTTSTPPQTTRNLSLHLLLHLSSDLSVLKNMPRENLDVVESAIGNCVTHPFKNQEDNKVARAGEGRRSEVTTY